MSEESQRLKERFVLETQMRAEFEYKLVRIERTEMYHDPDYDPQSSIQQYIYGRIQTLGVEWSGKDVFEVIINLDGTRMTFEQTEFMNKITVIE